MKICLINNIMNPFDRGGGSERISEIINHGFNNAGYDIFNISLRPVFKKAKRKNSYYLKSYFYNLYKFPLFLKLFWHFFNLFNINNFIKIFFIFKKEKPDLIISNNLMGIGMLLPLLTRILKIKHIHILHDLQLIYPSGLIFYNQEKKNEEFPAKVYLKITRFLISSPDYIISPSKWLLNMHSKNKFFKKSKKKVIPNPVVISGIEKKIKKEKKDVFKFLYVGQIEKHKGLNILINAFKNMPRNNFSNLRLEIIGTGTLFNKLKNGNKSDNSIVFSGKIHNQEVQKRMRKADCLIVPSLCYENSPTVIYEAMSNYLAVIASNLGGIPELIQNGRGLLFKPGSEDDLLEKMIWVKKNPLKIEEMTLRSFSYILERKEKKYINQLQNIINQKYY